LRCFVCVCVRTHTHTHTHTHMGDEQGGRQAWSGCGRTRSPQQATRKRRWSCSSHNDRRLSWQALPTVSLAALACIHVLPLAPWLPPCCLPAFLCMHAPVTVVSKDVSGMGCLVPRVQGQRLALLAPLAQNACVRAGTYARERLRARERESARARGRDD